MKKLIIKLLAITSFTFIITNATAHATPDETKSNHNYIFTIKNQEPTVNTANNMLLAYTSKPYTSSASVSNVENGKCKCRWSGACYKDNNKCYSCINDLKYQPGLGCYSCFKGGTLKKKSDGKWICTDE